EAGNGRRLEILGAAQWTHARSRNEKTRRSGGGSPPGLWSFRRHDSGGELWRRQGNSLGPGDIRVARRENPRRPMEGRRPEDSLPWPKAAGRIRSRQDQPQRRQRLAANQEERFRRPPGLESRG